MASVNPLEHADTLVSYGRKKETVRVLQDALAHQPRRSDLRGRLPALRPTAERATLLGHAAQVSQ